MRKATPLLLVALLAACAAQGTEGQQGEPQLQHVAEVHVKPGQVALFETAHANRNDRLAAAGVSRLFRSSVSEAIAYRFVTPVGDFEGLARHRAEMSEVAAPAAGAAQGSDAISHVDSYLRLTRPDLGYNPANPRLQASEWQAIRRIQIKVQQGKVGDVADILREVAELYRQNDIGERYSVSVRTLGPDTPIVEIQLFGSSVADIYEATSRTEGTLGTQLDALRSRIGEVARSVEYDNFTIRRDLNYRPSN